MEALGTQGLVLGGRPALPRGRPEVRGQPVCSSEHAGQGQCSESVSCHVLSFGVTVGARGGQQETTDLTLCCSLAQDQKAPHLPSC